MSDQVLSDLDIEGVGEWLFNTTGKGAGGCKRNNAPRAIV